MAYYSEEQIKKAKRIDLLTYLQNTNPDELVHDSRGTFKTKTHDSLKINNGMWYWFSRGIGGNSALEYLIQVQNFSFTDAVGHLIKQKGIEKKYISKCELTEKEKIDRFVLPKKAIENTKIVNYLLSRGISKNIINECISKGYIYQEFPRNNIVFVGYDENNKPRYAGVRGTNSSRYMHDAYGSDKTYSFQLKAIRNNNAVHLFESAIDLLSYATLKELKNEQWDEENLISLAGVYQPSKDILSSKIPKTLSHFLKSNNYIDTIILHLDNDEAGRLSTKAISNSLSDGYKIIDDPPKKGKDFNNYFTDFDREAYFIKSGDKYLGFVMINENLKFNKLGKSVAEFLIMPQYRRNHYGQNVAMNIFDMYKGNWEVQPIENNPIAYNFWKNTIDKYTNNNYEIKNDDIEDIFVFESK